MLSKLLSLVASAKGAAAAGVLATAALGGATVATNDDARQAVREAGDNIAQLVTDAADKVSEDRAEKDTEKGKPAVVAARNDADKKLRGAFHDDHKALEKLHRTHVDKADRQKLEHLINDADKKMRDRLTKALDDVAALTLGREGRENQKPNESTDIHATTVDQAKVDVIVTAAIADMKKILDDTTKAVQALPTSTTGKAGDNNKSENNKPENKGENTKGENTKPENASNNKPENPGKRP